jgi:hypothetical protein
MVRPLISIALLVDDEYELNGWMYALIGVRSNMTMGFVRGGRSPLPTDLTPSSRREARQ